MGEIRAPRQQLLHKRQPPALIQKHHAFHPCSQKWQVGMGPEAAFAGDRQICSTLPESNIGLGDAGLSRITKARHRAAKGAECIRIHALNVEQLRTQPPAQGPTDHPLLAVAGGQGHHLACVGACWGDQGGG
jgi:hypothetical protein